LCGVRCAPRFWLGTILETRGYEVTTAGTVAEALAAIQRQSYDVLLSDLNIGEPYDGFTVASATRCLHPNANGSGLLVQPALFVHTTFHVF